MTKSDNFSNIIPIMALYALAGYRLLPALQKVYSAFSMLRFTTSSLEDLHKDLINLNLPNKSNVQSTLTVKKNIVLKKYIITTQITS